MLALLLFLGLAVADDDDVVDRVAAIVNDEVIALSEVYDLGAPFIDEKCGKLRARSCVTEAELEVLDTLIMRTLIRQELQELGLDITKEELDRTIDQIGRDFGIEDRSQLRREIESSGMNWDTYREQLTEQLRTMKFQETIIRPRISVSEDEVRDLYRRSTRDMELPSEAEVSAITMALPKPMTEAELTELVGKAREVARAVNAGELDWDVAIAEYHSGFLADEDGSMPPVTEGSLMPALDKVVFSTEVGQVSDPVVVTAAGVLFLVRVEDLRTGGVVPYEEAQEGLRSKIYEQKIEEQLDQWYLQARREAAVKVLLGES